MKLLPHAGSGFGRKLADFCGFGQGRDFGGRGFENRGFGFGGESAAAAAAAAGSAHALLNLHLSLPCWSAFLARH